MNVKSCSYSEEYLKILWQVHVSMNCLYSNGEKITKLQDVDNFTLKMSDTFFNFAHMGVVIDDRCYFIH